MKWIKEIKASEITIIVLAFIAVLIHLLVINNLEYHRDELLYFSLGQHLAFGYNSVPPLVGWIACLMESIFGYSLFAVRLFPALMSGVMVVLVAGIARQLGGRQYARIIAGLGIIIPIFALRSFAFFMPVYLDIFFWTLSIYLIIKYINTGSDKILLVFGLVAGLALLNKYLIGLLFLIILVIIPFTRHRIIFRKKMFWTGILAGAVVFLPNLIWQIVNGMPVFGHLSELARTQLVYVNPASFLMEQILSPGAASILTIAGLIYLLINKSVIKFRFLGLAAIIVIVSLMLMHGKSYYTQGIFPFLIGAGAVSFERLLKHWSLRIVLPGILIFMTISILPYGLPIYGAEGLIKYFNYLESEYGMDVGRTFENGSKHSLPQDYADMLGWEELTAVAAKAYRMSADRKACIIYCENYGQAGAITIIGKKYGLPEAVCFSESFQYWYPEKFEPDITSFIYINHELGQDVKWLFRKIYIVGSITNPDAREYGATVYLCEDPVCSFNEFWKERIGKE
jgi:hypothetical protein